MQTFFIQCNPIFEYTMHFDIIYFDNFNRIYLLIYSVTYFRSDQCSQNCTAFVSLSSLRWPRREQQLDTVSLLEPADPHADLTIRSANRRLGRHRDIDIELGASVRDLIVAGNAIIVIKGRFNHKLFVERYSHRRPK